MDFDKLANELLVNGRPIATLKVVELRDELKRRGLKNSGNKPQLQESLVSAIFQEQQYVGQIQQVQPPIDPSYGISVEIPQINPTLGAGGDAYSVLQNQDHGVKLIIRTSPTKSTPIIAENVEPIMQSPQPTIPTPVVQAQPIQIVSPEVLSPVQIQPIQPVQPEPAVVVPVTQVIPETIPQMVSAPEPVVEAAAEPLSQSQPETIQQEAASEQSPVQETQSISNVSEPVLEKSDSQMDVSEEEKLDVNDVTMKDDNNTSVENTTHENERSSTVAAEESEASVRRSDSPKLTIRPRKLTLQRSQNQAESESPQIDKAAEKRPKWGSKRESSAQKGITSNELKQIIDESRLLEDNNNNNPSQQKVGKNDSTFIKADISMEDSSLDTSDATAAAAGGGGAAGVGNVKKSQDSNDISAQNVSGGSAINVSGSQNDAKIERPKTPAKNAPSCVLHITGLARPYTMKKLKNLLNDNDKRPYDESKFWTDKKRSECYVLYSSIEIAQQARENIHGLRWPDASPSILSVDFGSETNLEKLLNEPEENVSHRKSDEGKNGMNEKYDIVRNDIDKSHSASTGGVSGASKGSALTKTIREWDKNKDDTGSNRRKRDDSRSRSPTPKRRDRRPSPSDRKASRQNVQSSSQPSQKMDDLFKKTVAQPHIYYKPLNDEEARQRDIEYRSRPRPVFNPRKVGRFMDHRRRRTPPFRRDRSFTPPPNRRGGPAGGYRPGRFRSPPSHQMSPGPYRRSSPPRRQQSPPSFRRRGMSPQPFRRGQSPPMHMNRRGRSPDRRGSPPPRRGSPPPRDRRSPSFRRGSPPPRRRSPPRYRR